MPSEETRPNEGPMSHGVAGSATRSSTIRRMASPEPIPPDLFLSGYPHEIRELAERLRGVVHEAVPEAIERVRSGWRLIGYDVPIGRKTRYFAFVAPEPEHVHLGFEYGIWMTDPGGLLLGAHLNLRKVRFVTYEPGDSIPTDALVRYTREAAELATLGSAGRIRPRT
jgi:hypothetical protein